MTKTLLVKTFYVRAVVNNNFSEYVKVVLQKKSEISVTYGEMQYESESKSDNRIVIEDSVMDPASPVEPVNCNGLHLGGTATCTAKAICEDCGEYYGEFAAHTYENGICTVCKATVPETDNPQTGDNSNLWLWFALLFISGTGLFGITIYDRKRKTASKR